jgi:RND family efflux transporter MFP subunit
MMKQALCLLAATMLLAGCWSEDEDTDAAEPIVRGLKTVLVAENERSVLRRFPSVLQPSELTTVGFETGGRLTAIDLRVGQVVTKGETLAQLDRKAVEIQIASSRAAVVQSRVAAENSADNLARQEALLKKGTVTRVAVDNARTDATSAAQAMVQAERALDSAQKSADDTTLVAPFDGVISAVDAQSFATVAAGTPIATLYRADGFEVSFTVNYDTINRMAVGKLATLRLADAPDRALRGVVTELGASADTVSSFPVVISVIDPPQDIKSGMAVEVNLEFELPIETGYKIPISAAVIEGTISGARSPTEPSPIQMFVYDPATKTVNKRQVFIAGVRENSVLVIKGLEAGERVASAGVSFLTDGQSVVLLKD